MNLKNISKYVAIICAVAVMFTACSKDENFVENKSLKGEVAIDASQSFKVLKGGILTKPGIAYVMTNSGLVAHKTIKVRNFQCTIIQEWFVEDLKADCMGEFTINSTGYYYPWSQIKQLIDGGDLPFLVCNSNYTPLANPFHLPKIDSYVGANNGDITKLASMLGSKSLVRSKLNLDYDGMQYAVPEYNPNHACMWMEGRGTYAAPNLNGEWGVHAKWDKANNDAFWHVFPNFGVRANVRLVRNITMAEWYSN